MIPVPLALLPLLAPPAPGPYSAPPPAMPPVRMAVSSMPSTPWSIETDVRRNKILVRHDREKLFSLDIDCDDHTRDNRYEGVTLVIGSRRLEGLYHGSTVSFFSPDHDAGPVASCAVAALDSELRIRFENGSYRRLHPAGPDTPVFFELIVRIDKERRPVLFLNGLYYLFQSQKDTRIRIPGHPEKRFHSGSKSSIEYFEHVTGFEAEDSVFGAYTFAGLVERLQLQVVEAAGTELMEIDFDHTYKDRGQNAVPAVLRFQEPLPSP